MSFSSFTPIRGLNSELIDNVSVTLDHKSKE